MALLTDCSVFFLLLEVAVVAGRERREASRAGKGSKDT